MKIDREKVWLKYDKHCAYCGKKIPFKEMQTDHIIPRAFSDWMDTNVDDFINLNPSCKRCNHYKRALKLEDFRTIYLGKLHERLQKQYTIKVAIDYGIITIKPFDGKFYFEKESK
jgi:5-methylcytosine-specific restriction endonuclease McrA